MVGASSEEVDVFRCIGSECFGSRTTGVHAGGCKTCAEPEQANLTVGCIANYTGHHCQTCIDKYESKTVEVRENVFVKKCLPCDEQDGSTWKVMGGFVAVATVVWVARKRIAQKVHARVSVEQIKTLKATLRSSWQPVRIVITYFQVTAQLGPVLSMQYPPLFEAAIAETAKLLEVLDVFASGKCLGVDGFHHKWFAQVVVMPSLMFALAITFFLKERHYGNAEAGVHLTGNVFFIVFFCYPKICNFSFAVFICRIVHTMPETVSVLVADDRVMCEDPTHTAFKLVSVILIGAVAFGVPCATAFFLRRDAMSRQKRGVDDSLKREVAEAFQMPLDEAEIAVNDVRLGSTYGFLVDAYKPQHYYWESLDMARKLLLVGMVLLVERGSVTQVLIALVISFLFIAAQANLWPYKIQEDNRLRVFTEFHVFLTIAVALAFKTDLDSPFAASRSASIDDEERYQDDVTSRKIYYDYFLMGTFMVMVPGAWVATVVSKLRKVNKVLQASDGPTEHLAAGMKAAYQRYSLGLAEGSDHMDLVDYFASLDADEHVRAGQRLWRTKQMVSHFDSTEMTRLIAEVEQQVPKSHSIGFHFTDMNSARLILNSRGIRASTVGQLGGGVSICLASLPKLGWGRDKYTKVRYIAQLIENSLACFALSCID
jgi:hypothetical protein